MAKRIRCRCPLCGMLVTQEQLNGEHYFEFVIQEVGSRGRGRIYNVYRKASVTESSALQMFTMALAQKLYAVADRLVEKIGAEASKKKAKEKAIASGEIVDAEYTEIAPAMQLSPTVEYDGEVVDAEYVQVDAEDVEVEPLRQLSPMVEYDEDEDEDDEYYDERVAGTGGGVEIWRSVDVESRVEEVVERTAETYLED